MTEITISYNQPEIILSIIIAIFSSYSALNMIDRINYSSEGFQRFYWLTLASLAMGIGTWSMHFLGMMAMQVNIPVAYDGVTILLSMLASIFTFYFAFYSLIKEKSNYLMTGTIMAFGIASMHYIGMKAMIVQAKMEHSINFLILAITVGILASTLSVYLFSKFKNEEHSIKAFILPSAITMGFSISGVHYTAMAGFKLFNDSPNHQMIHFEHIDFVLNPENLIIQVFVISFIILALSIFLATKNRIKTFEYVQKNQKRYQLIAEHSSDMIAEMNFEGDLVYISPSYEQALGYTPEELLGKTFWFASIHPSDIAKVESGINDLIKDQETEFKAEYRRKDKEGNWIWLETIGTTVKGQGNQLASVIFSSKDISERKAFERKLKEMAYYDHLTNTLNRAYFEEKLQKTIHKGNGNKFAILFFDCDQFKWINDSFGHSIGDQCLKILVSKIKSYIKDEDIIGRFGGDEFVVLIKNIQSKANVKDITESILSSLSKPVEVNGIKMSFSTSVGISIFPDDSSDGEELIKFADRSLYKVKKQGKNGYQFFNNELNKNIKREMQLANDLRFAIQNDELFLNYQPLIKLANNEVVGIEALVRWRHPDLGLISPVEFITIAENNGLIKEITEWVLLTTCRELAKWSDISVAVNISSMLFYNKTTLVNLIKETLMKTGINPSLLTLEITETAVMEDISISLDILEELKSLGVRIALDDFGTGLSSLTYIRELPFDVLKIDKAFIKRIPGNAKDAFILRRIIQLAKDLELKVVVEGVEKEEQVDVLLGEEVNLVQGFLFSKPLNKEHLEVFLRQHRGEAISK